MTTFKQKEYSEYEAMRSLYVELMKFSDRNKFEIIDRSNLIPVLKGNNVVVERFVISTSPIFGKESYRMYIKIGAKAKLPDEVRLPERVYDKKLAYLTFKMNKGIMENNPPVWTPNDKKDKNFSGGGGGNKPKGPGPVISTELSPGIDLSYKVKELLGEAIKYDKKGRSLVLEFSSIRDAISALNLLPFGLNYKIFLLNS